jgi:hypothetical protein
LNKFAGEEILPQSTQRINEIKNPKVIFTIPFGFGAFVLF